MKCISEFYYLFILGITESGFFVFIAPKDFTMLPPPPLTEFVLAKVGLFVPKEASVDLGVCDKFDLDIL